MQVVTEGSFRRRSAGHTPTRCPKFSSDIGETALNSIGAISFPGWRERRSKHLKNSSGSVLGVVSP